MIPAFVFYSIASCVTLLYVLNFIRLSLRNDFNNYMKPVVNRLLTHYSSFNVACLRDLWEHKSGYAACDCVLTIAYKTKVNDIDSPFTIDHSSLTNKPWNP